MQTPPPQQAGNDDEPPELMREATRWVIRLTSGETTSEERDAFRRWRDQSPDHAAALAMARSQWLALGEALETRSNRPAPRTRNRLRIAAMAASVLAMVFAGQQTFIYFNHDYRTGAGDRQSVTLPDGTTMVLGGRSAVDVRYSDQGRTVEVARGVAYFDIAEDDARPFLVIAGDGLVRDIGTAFSVRRIGKGGEVVVSEGEVQISQRDGRTKPVHVTPGQQAAFGPGATPGVKPVDAAADLSWTDGRLILVNRSLSEAALEINRHSKDRVVVLGEQTAAKRVSAVIDLEHVDAWLAALDVAGTADVTRIGNVTLLR